MIRAAVLLALALSAGPAASAEIALPGATRTASVTDPAAPWTIATGPAVPGAHTPGLTLEGPRVRTAWRAEPHPGAGLRLTQDLRAALVDAGFEVVFACRSTACGGFDFRRNRDLLPMPDMIVDLSGYTWFTARKGPAEAPEAVAGVLVSEGPAGAFAHLTRVDAAPDPPAGAPPADAAEPETAADDGTPFDARGRMVIDGLAFAPGSATLPDTLPDGIATLADWLRGGPARRVALVGHTDWSGPADANRALSRARAAAVADALTERFGIAADRLVVEGAGPFAPRVSNAEAAGRAANRRVEAVRLPPAQ